LAVALNTKAPRKRSLGGVTSFEAQKVTVAVTEARFPSLYRTNVIFSV
jgi:hypothetical protein